MVDVIHTDAGVLGADKDSGTVDFWPNGGIDQPGCNNPLLDEPTCNHARSWRYFAESVATPKKIFFAMKCTNYDTFKQINCTDNVRLNNMGINAIVG